jgi:Xaa-Pro aminopeptidase
MSALKRLQEKLETLEADAILVSSELNCRYLSDFAFSDGYLLIEREYAFLITDSRYVEAAKNTVKNFEILCPKDTRISAISELVSARKIKALAVEDESMSIAEHKRFSDALPCELVAGASVLISELRRVKTPEELNKIAAAQRITDAAFEHILGFISPDVTECDVALELEFFMRKMGADGLAFDTIAVSGTASSLPHGVPSDIKLRRGFLTMDFGAKLDGYCSDMTRTVCIGHADDEMRKVYSTVLSAQERALENICEGMLCRDADALARDIIKSAGYGENFCHSLGHGVGLYIHESPSLSPLAKESSRLERGHVVTVEPGIYLEGRFGVRIEDMIAIDHDGSVRNFTSSQKNLIEL